MISDNEEQIQADLLYRCLDLRHVAARDGEGFVAVLNEQLSGAGM